MALTQVNSDGMKDDSIKNADVKSDAAIATSKLSGAVTGITSVSYTHLTLPTKA